MNAIDRTGSLVKIKAGPHDLRDVFASFYFWLVVTSEVVSVEAAKKWVRNLYLPLNRRPAKSVNF